MQIAIPFYSRDNFVKITAMLPNSDWPKTYEDWIGMTETGERGVKKSGNVPVRINVEPAAFEAWCKDHDQPITRISIPVYCGFVLASGIIQSGSN